MAKPDRYTMVAVLLHWLIAAAIVFMIGLGWWMTDAFADVARRGQAISAFQIHKSLGITVLALSVVRLFWRLLHRPPPLPNGTPSWERFLARGVHVIFYLLMIGMPLSGWVYVSTGWSTAFNAPMNIPTIWFGLFQVPHLPGLSDGVLIDRKTAAELAHDAHALLAYGALGLLALHVGAALKHHFINKDEVLGHMLPFIKPHMHAKIGAPEQS